jgi:hypothetical protein
MVMPQFKSLDEAKDYFSEKISEVLRKIEGAKTPEEKLEYYLEFISKEFELEVQVLGNVQIKDIKEYQDIKKVVFDFLTKIEQNFKVNFFIELNKDQFETDNINYKLPLMVPLINLTQTLPLESKDYILLNLFRTTYELNLKPLKTILKSVLIKEGKKLFNGINFWQIFMKEFNYPEAQGIRDFFINDIRNPIAHEDWFLDKGGNIKLRDNQGQIVSYNDNQISLEIHKLFFLRVAITSYLMKSSMEFTKSKITTKEEIDNLIEGFKKGAETIKKVK